MRLACARRSLDKYRTVALETLGNLQLLWIRRFAEKNFIVLAIWRVVWPDLSFGFFPRRFDTNDTHERVRNIAMRLQIV